MEGAGNDYIYIDCLQEVPADLPELARQISNRHFGVGSDGLVVILPGSEGDFRMRMFNSDGSEGKMCGNASRCIAKYVYERGLTEKTEILLETLSGLKRLLLNIDSGEVRDVTVDMGIPELTPALIPVKSRNSDEMVLSEETVGGVTFRITAVSMGNPHAVIFSDILNDHLVLGYGPMLEVSPIFPERANIEFVNVIDRETIEMRVWERGSGETLACGTGACASVVACILCGKTGRNVTVKLRGGELKVFWNEKDNHVYLTGGAEFICDGTYYFKCSESH